MSAEQLAPLLTPGSLRSEDSSLVDESFVLPILTALDGAPEVTHDAKTRCNEFILHANIKIVFVFLFLVFRVCVLCVCVCVLACVCVCAHARVCFSIF